MSNVRHRRNAKPSTMKVQLASSSRLSNARTSQAVNPPHGRAKSPKSLAASARAVRPASLVASAPPQRFGTTSTQSTEPALSVMEKACLPKHSFLGRTNNPMSIEAIALLGQVTGVSRPMRALRSSAKPNTRGRAGTSCYAARAGGFGLFASGFTQRTMRAGCVPQSAMPNPSIERDVQELSLLAAPHVKR